MTTDHLIIFASWVVYYTLHSTLATDKIKNWWRNAGFKLNYWRLIYSMISSIGLLILGGLLVLTPSDLIMESNNITRFLGMMFATYGVIVVRISFRNYSLRDFLFKEDRFDEDQELEVTGIHSRVRHPLYSGTILIIVGMLFFVPKISSLITVVVTLLYLAIGINLEEKKLIKKYGNKYQDYKKNVPALIPTFWKASEKR